MNQTPTRRERLLAFIRGDHRYVFLGGSVLAALCLLMLRMSPTVSSFVGTDNFFSGFLTGVCALFLALSLAAFVFKLTHWHTYAESFMKKPPLLRAARYVSYLVALCFICLVIDRLIINLADVVAASIGSSKNPREFLPSMIYMLYNCRAFFVTGVWTTVRFALLGTAIAFVLALLMTFMRISKPDKRDNDFVKFLKKLGQGFSGVYITVIRGTPMMVQALIIYFAGFRIFTSFTGMSVSEINRIWSLFFSGLVTVSLNSTAYLAEVLRGGIEAIDQGQMEAARSLGMTNWQAIIKVVFPQAVKNSIPAIGNEFIINIKDSSVLSVIGVMDLMVAANSTVGIYYRQLEVYFIAAIIYLILTYLSSLLLKYLSKRLDMPVRGIPSSN